MKIKNKKIQSLNGLRILTIEVQLIDLLKDKENSIMEVIDFISNYISTIKIIDMMRNIEINLDFETYFNKEDQVHIRYGKNKKWYDLDLGLEAIISEIDFRIIIERIHEVLQLYDCLYDDERKKHKLKIFRKKQEKLDFKYQSIKDVKRRIQHE